MNFITSYDNDPWERGAVVVGVGKTWGGEGWLGGIYTPEVGGSILGFSKCSR